MDWILILTVTFGAQGVNLPAAAAIESMPHFSSETSCQQAGEEWLVDLKAHKKNYKGSSFYTCVSDSG